MACTASFDFVLLLGDTVYRTTSSSGGCVLICCSYYSFLAFTIHATQSMVDCKYGSIHIQALKHNGFAAR